jgi:hypothetical protein
MKSIARKISDHPLSGKKSEVAAGYGLTIEEFNRASYDFLQSEGYDDMGNEYNSLHYWLIIPHKEFIDRTPRYKADDLDI